MIQGTGFTADTRVLPGDDERPAKIESGTRIVVQLPEDEAADVLAVKLARGSDGATLQSAP